MIPSPLITAQGGEITLTFRGIMDQMLRFLTLNLGCFLKMTPIHLSSLNFLLGTGFFGAPNAPRPLPPIAQVQLPPGYTNIDNLERRINHNVERMINANIERMMRMMIEQFFQLASSSREPGTFPSQPEVNPKGHTSSSSGDPSELVRKVNAVISLRSGREIDN